MGKYQFGGYCPKCIRPVDELLGRLFLGYATHCCPHCGFVQKSRREHIIWPTGSFRSTLFWPFSRWVPTETTREEANKMHNTTIDEQANGVPNA